MDIDLDKIKSFCALADLENLNKAAQHLAITPSWISKQVMALEKLLNCKLFYRKSKKFTLTEHGKIFLEHARRIVHEMNQAKNLLEATKKTMTGKIKISVTQATAGLFMIDAITDFLKKHHNVSLHIVADDEENLLNAGKTDVAIRPLLTHLKNPDDFQQSPLTSYQMNLYASKDYVKNNSAIKSLNDLHQHKIITYGEYLSAPYEEINWHLKYLSEGFSPFLSINSGIALLRAVENSLGIASLSQIGARQSSVELVKILPNHPGPTIQVYFYCPKTIWGSYKIRLLYEHLLGFFSEQKTS